jgi:hypothetical protein
MARIPAYGPYGRDLERLFCRATNDAFILRLVIHEL